MVMRKKSLICCLIFAGILLFGGLSAVSNAAERNYLRVGLFYGNTSEDRYEIYFDNGVRIGRLSDNYITNESNYEDVRKVIAIAKNGYSEIVLQDKHGDEIRRFDLADRNIVLPLDFEDDGSFSVKGQNYRGGVYFNDFKGTLNLINYIDEEKYLYGVVGNEIGKSVPIEAQKAQAIACRSYARVKRGTHENYGFDICSTPHCQYYKGKDSEVNAVRRAVDDTFAKTVKYDGKTVAAFYSKNSGGYTSASEDIWNERLGYLRAKQDIYSPDFTWKKSISKREIETKLINAGKSIGDLQAMRIEERSDAGAVKRLAFIGNTGTVIIEKDKIRTTLGASDIKSLMFTFGGDFRNVSENKQSTQHSHAPVQSNTINVIGKEMKTVIDVTDNVACIITSGGENQVQNIQPANLKGIAKSGLFTLPDTKSTQYNAPEIIAKAGSLSDRIGGGDYIKVDDTVLFTGLGYGHGVGMSQDGAIEMAKRGFTYDEILNYYYKDISIE